MLFKGTLVVSIRTSVAYIGRLIKLGAMGRSVFFAVIITQTAKAAMIDELSIDTCFT